MRSASGWTDLVVTPRRGVRVVDGLHEPEASHLLMLEATVGRPAPERGHTAAVRRLYRWHEFGDVHLVLPDEDHSLSELRQQLQVKRAPAQCDAAHRTHITYEGT